MNMKPNSQQIQKATSTLNKVFLKYKSRGLVSIYLWGSVLTKDYVPNKSDIDSVGLVKDDASMKDVDTIREFLAKEAPELKNFKINYICLSELNTGKIKSLLASRIHPNLLLLDFPNWKHVAGKRFKRSDFKLKDVNFEEAIELEIENIKIRHLPKLRQKDYSSAEYFCKELMKICHWLNLKQKRKQAFTYKKLLMNSPESRKNIVKLLLKIRQNNWNKQLIKRKLNILLEFLHNLD